MPGSGLMALDTAMGGGIAPGMITELVGPAGIGKTQLCIAAAFEAAHAALAKERVQHAVLVIDSEHRFSRQRLAQMAAHRVPLTYDPAIAVDALQHAARLQSLVRVVSVSSMDEMQMAVLKAQDETVLQGTRVVIIDSVAAPARMLSPQQATRQLLQLAAACKSLAGIADISVLCTNHVQAAPARAGIDLEYQQAQVVQATAGPAARAPDLPELAPAAIDIQLVAALGQAWGHAVNTRVSLAQHAPPHAAMPQHVQDMPGVRYATVVKSPSMPVLSVPFNVSSAGVSSAAFHSAAADG